MNPIRPTILWRRALPAVFAAVLLLQTWHKAHRPQGYDLTSYLLAARALLHGGDPYRIASPFPFIYPLFLPLALAPLTLVPYGAAVVLWFLFNLGCLIGAFRLSLELLPPGGRKPATGLLLLLGALHWPVIASNLLNGQANYPVLLLLLWGMRAAARDRPLPAAAGLGAAIAIKVAPAVALLHPALRRRWRALTLALLAAAALCALPLIATGPRLLGLYGEYAQRILLAPLRDPAFPLQDRVWFGLPGLAVRCLGPTPAARLAAGAGVLLALAAVIAAGRRALPQLLLLTMLLIGPKSETHHLAFAMPAILTLGAAAGRAPRGVAAWLSIAALALGGLWPAGPVLFLGVLGLWLCQLSVGESEGPNAKDS
jgi:hypothetical protein